MYTGERSSGQELNYMLTKQPHNIGHRMYEHTVPKYSTTHTGPIM